MFKFVSPEGHHVLATVHSDDVDMICEAQQAGVAIADASNTRFGGDEDGIKMCRYVPGGWHDCVRRP